MYSELLGGTGHLESTVSDEAVLAAARRLRLLPEGNGAVSAAVTTLVREARGGDERAAALLTERARALGEAVALLRDVLNPDDLVVGGQGFTEYPEGMAEVERAFTQRSVLSARSIRVTAFGNRVQEAGSRHGVTGRALRRPGRGDAPVPRSGRPRGPGSVRLTEPVRMAGWATTLEGLGASDPMCTE